MNSNLFLALSVLINIVIFFKHKKLSYMFNVYDYPNERKLHKHKTPLLGGLIIIINLLLFSAFYFLSQYKKMIYFIFK